MACPLPLDGWMRRLWWIAALAACGDPSPPSVDANPDGSQGSAYDPAAIYDLTALRDPATLELAFGTDRVSEVVPGRFVREVRFGFLGLSGFPLSASQIGVGPRMFVETTESGVPLGTLDRLAVALHTTAASDDYGIRCALETSVVCVLAGNVGTPSQISPPYPNEYGSGTITDSNQLWFNLLSEFRRGHDIEASPIATPTINRLYETQLARLAMRTITASQAVATQLWSAPPMEVVITGHSKWGATAAQVAAVDDRVTGVLVMGFALDFARFVELADTRWNAGLGLDIMPVVCPPEHPCGWSTSASFHAFFEATPEAPEACEGRACSGTGEEWLRQVDLRRLRAGGHLARDTFALIRNGGEAHPVDTESPAVAAQQGPGQFLFLPNSSHVFDTPLHAALWRHWIRHTARGLPTLRLTPTITSSGSTVIATVETSGATITQARLFVRPSTDEVYGELDGVPGYTPTGSWQATPAVIDGGRITASAPWTGTSAAAVVLVEFDDGSGDRAWVSTPVTIVRGASVRSEPRGP